MFHLLTLLFWLYLTKTINPFSLGYMFWAARMDHWCHVTGLDHMTNLTSDEKMKLTIPLSSGGSSQKYSQCHMYGNSFFLKLEFYLAD